MTIFLDKRAGSINLRPHLQAAGLSVEMGQWSSDVEFCGQGGSPVPLIIGIEYKSVSDCLTAMSDGRLTGTQLANMEQSGVARKYLCIEGALRYSADGILETKHFDPTRRQYYWGAAHGRGGEGWTAREFWGRILSLEEFWGVRVQFTYKIEESAAWIIALYKYWQKPYHEHSSYRQWDQSGDSGPALSRGNVLMPTSDLPLVQRAARELSGVGQHKAGYVALHFRTLAAMALADNAEWAKVSWREKLKKGGERVRHFGKDVIRDIIKEIWEG